MVGRCFIRIRPRRTLRQRFLGELMGHELGEMDLVVVGAPSDIQMPTPCATGSSWWGYFHAHAWCALLLLALLAQFGQIMVLCLLHTCLHARVPCVCYMSYAAQACGVDFVIVKGQRYLGAMLERS
eukprot:9470945-Pyramimonas_sp.AAC.2